MGLYRLYHGISGEYCRMPSYTTYVNVRGVTASHVFLYNLGGSICAIVQPLVAHQVWKD